MNQGAAGLAHTPPGPGRNVGVTLVRIAAVYLMVGLVMGIGMGITHNFALLSAHSHISLLGWATMAIAGVVYIVMPACRNSRLAPLHFWGHNAGLPIMTGSLALSTMGFEGAETAIAGGSIVVFASLLIFTINVFLNGRQTQS